MKAVMAETDVGELLRIARVQRSLSLKEAAGLMGRSESWLQRIETGGHKVQPAHVHLIARAYNMSVGEIMDQEGSAEFSPPRPTGALLDTSFVEAVREAEKLDELEHLLGPPVFDATGRRVLHFEVFLPMETGTIVSMREAMAVKEEVRRKLEALLKSR